MVPFLENLVQHVQVESYATTWNTYRWSLTRPHGTRTGGVLRDHMELVMGVLSISVGIKDSNEAELIAVAKALELSSLRGDLSNKKLLLSLILLVL